MELKPCPFCGSKIVGVADRDFLSASPSHSGISVDVAVCGVCGACGPMAESTEEAIAVWNQRVDSICGIKTTINFSGDLKVEGYWKKWTTEDEFTCIKYTRSGLVYLTDPDGKNVTVPKRNCNALK